MKVNRTDLKKLISNKLIKAGLGAEDADVTSDVLVWADERGYHSHGAVRVAYYSERIFNGGITVNPKYEYKQTGPCSAVLDCDNGIGFVGAKEGTLKAIELAKKNGIGVVGIKNISHSGSLGYYTELASQNDMLGFSVCQSDPMVVPFGGKEPFYGTNPISFSAPSDDSRTVIFDMATTVQAWGKILDKRARNEKIPADWAVDENGNPVTDPNKVMALLPIAGAKGYGLMMMVDILSGVLLGVPAGKNVSSMYDDLSKGRELGQLVIVINPEFFTGVNNFKKAMSDSLDELSDVPAADGFDKVSFPGERAEERRLATLKDGGIDIADSVYEYLVSDKIHLNQYNHKNRFGE